MTLINLRYVKIFSNLSLNYFRAHRPDLNTFGAILKSSQLLTHAITGLTQNK